MVRVPSISQKMAAGLVRLEAAVEFDTGIKLAFSIRKKWHRPRWRHTAVSARLRGWRKLALTNAEGKDLEVQFRNLRQGFVVCSGGRAGVIDKLRELFLFLWLENGIVLSAIKICQLTNGLGPVSYTHLTLPTICSV